MSNLKWCQYFSEVLGLWDRSPQTSSYHRCSCLSSSPIHFAYLGESYCHRLELPLCFKVSPGSSLLWRAELKLYSKAGASIFNLAFLPCLTLPQDKSSTSSVSEYTLHASLLTLFPWLKFPSTLPFCFPPVPFLPILPAPISHVILASKGDLLTLHRMCFRGYTDLESNKFSRNIPQTSCMTRGDLVNLNLVMLPQL